MGELWDIYDRNKQKTGKTAERGVYQFKEGEYHIVVTGIILNSKNEILISKRAEFKKYGGMWECNGGSILAGETSLQGIIRELKEELGIQFAEKEAVYTYTEHEQKLNPDFIKGSGHLDSPFMDILFQKSVFEYYIHHQNKQLQQIINFQHDNSILWKRRILNGNRYYEKRISAL